MLLLDLMLDIENVLTQLIFTQYPRTSFNYDFNCDIRIDLQSCQMCTIHGKCNSQMVSALTSGLTIKH